MKYAMFLLVLATPAFAEDAPTVTLTQSELSEYANVVQAQTAAQIAAAQAKPVLDKIKAAFTPKPVEPAK